MRLLAPLGPALGSAGGPLAMDLETAKSLSRGIAGHALLVGLIALHFNEAEHRFQALVGRALGLTPRAGAALAAQLAQPVLIEMLRAAARRHGAGERLVQAARLFEAARGNRNLIVHGLFTDPGVAPGDVLVMRKTSSRGGVKPGEWRLPAAELETVVVEILAVSEFLAALSERLGAADGPWPETPPTPARRPDTLQPLLPPSD